jgi:hypothetical protein
MDCGLRGEAGVECALEQTADVFRPERAKADVPYLRVYMMADVEFIRFVAAGPDGRFDRIEPTEEKPGNCDPRVWNGDATVVLALGVREQAGYLFARRGEVAFAYSLAIVPAEGQSPFPPAIYPVMDATFVSAAPF